MNSKIGFSCKMASTRRMDCRVQLTLRVQMTLKREVQIQRGKIMMKSLMTLLL